MPTVDDVPIYAEVAEEQRTRTGAFARFALDQPAPPEGTPTGEQPAVQPTTEPLEAQPVNRSGRPRSQR